ncbi:ABC transporter ATP-binding protein/permease [Tetragenococcus koreensis]|uniref:ABC transporter ATP-binding protein n=1 Tax=Tetragenococcus koreensis TaxID=290335 RepID=UPI001F2E611A|nr:ABC transporter ATP-binding protein [Tetragenococcus koreensis]MCF1585067.1 ABC transporter ATP-binding protein/permease [Tetragenococcus koreensis]MCF1629405.1 ABC transporter ATP-binding protein/permease [Tetragenococcus koreensis]
MSQVLHFAKSYRKQIILGPVFKFLEAIFELILPLLMASLVDDGIQKGNWPIVVNRAIWMLVISIIGLGCAVVCQYFASVASQGYGTELRNQLMKKVNQLSHQELNDFGTDTLITRMTNDINQVQLALAMLIRLVVRAPFLSIGAVVMAFFIDWQMGLIFLIVLPTFCLILFGIITRSVPLYQKVQSYLDRINEIVAQNLSGVRVIRAFSRRKTEVDRFDESTDKLSSVYVRVSNISALLNPATTLIMNIGVLGILTIGGFKVNIGGLQQGQILALVNYMNQMLLALIVVSNLVVIFTRAFASASRIEEVFDATVEIHDPKESITPKKTGGAIQFSHVDFRFSVDFGLALKDIDFTVEAGKTIGITGPTGSGKTALTQLIPRFYDVADGAVLVDDVDVRKWPLTDLRKNVGTVQQTAILFTGTIRENLQWGKNDATDEECWRALEIAQAQEFVSHLPQGLDTPVYEGGKNLSGGQQQRLTIARALIKQPEILILDDSLSALDYQTDYNLRQTLKGLDCTVLVISQRIRSIQDASQIFVMEAGRLVAKGTHEKLLETSQEYQEIVASQEEGNQ